MWHFLLSYHLHLWEESAHPPTPSLATPSFQVVVKSINISSESPSQTPFTDSHCLVILSPPLLSFSGHSPGTLHGSSNKGPKTEHNTQDVPSAVPSTPGDDHSSWSSSSTPRTSRSDSSLLCCISSRHQVSWSPAGEQGLAIVKLLPAAYGIFHPPLDPGWAIWDDSHCDICLIGLPPGSCP